MFFLRPPPAASKRTRVCFFGGEAAEKTHILFCARYLELVGDLGFEGKIVNFLMRQGGKMGA